MSTMDLYDYAIRFGLQPQDLVDLGISPDQQQVAVPTAPAAPGTAPAGSPNLGVGGLTASQLDAQAIVATTLRSYGLDSLTDWANEQIAAGATADQINLELYDPQSTPGKVVNQLYPEIQIGKANRNLVSISQAVTYRKTAAEYAHAAGFPVGILDFGQLIGGGVSLDEVQSRLHDYYAVAMQQNPDVYGELQNLYGLSKEQIAAHALDPALTTDHLLAQLDAGKIGAAGVRTGFGQLGVADAEQLAGQGISAAQAQQGFTDLTAQRPLFTPLPGEGGDAVSRAQQLAGEFGGDAAAQRQTATIRARRQAAFKGSGGFGASQSGVGGLGTTDAG